MTSAEYKHIRDALCNAITFLEEEFPIAGRAPPADTSVTAEAHRLVSELCNALADLRASRAHLAD
jgi:hypothetical protein